MRPVSKAVSVLRENCPRRDTPGLAAETLTSSDAAQGQVTNDWRESYAIRTGRACRLGLERGRAFEARISRERALQTARVLVRFINKSRFRLEYAGESQAPGPAGWLSRVLLRRTKGEGIGASKYQPVAVVQQQLHEDS